MYKLCPSTARVNDMISIFEFSTENNYETTCWGIFIIKNLI